MTDAFTYQLERMAKDQRYSTEQRANFARELSRRKNSGKNSYTETQGGIPYKNMPQV